MRMIITCNELHPLLLHACAQTVALKKNRYCVDCRHKQAYNINEDNAYNDICIVRFVQHYYKPSIHLICSARCDCSASSSNSINVPQEAGTPLPASQCWNMAWQQASTPSAWWSALIVFRVRQSGSKSRKRLKSFQTGAKCLIICTFCPSAVFSILSWASRGLSAKKE